MFRNFAWFSHRILEIATPGPACSIKPVQIRLEQRVRENAKALTEVFFAMPRSRIALVRTGLLDLIAIAKPFAKTSPQLGLGMFAPFGWVEDFLRSL